MCVLGEAYPTTTSRCNAIFQNLYFRVVVYVQLNGKFEDVMFGVIVHLFGGPRTERLICFQVYDDYEQAMGMLECLDHSIHVLASFYAYSRVA